MKNLNIDDSVIKFYAIRRIANLFKIQPEFISFSDRFGDSLKASGSSGMFIKNEFDIIENDILDVCDSETYKKISSGFLSICTVGDYCEHMVLCYKKKPDVVMAILGINYF